MKCKMESEESSQLRASGSRHTRSQAAPEWTVKGALILANEYAAVEADCSDALSSYQKWKIIAENCTALDVPRTLNQCRRKWDSLAAEYGKIKKWELRSRSGSYWSLESERRRKFGLPEDFDYELFKAVDDFMSARENRSDTEPESDPEAKAEMADVVEELGLGVVVYQSERPNHNRTDTGFKRQRRQFTSQKSWLEGKPLKCHIKEEPSRRSTEEKPRKRRLEDPVNSLTEENPQKSCIKGKHQKGHVEEPVENPLEEKPKRSHGKGETRRSHAEEEETIGTEAKEQMMVMKLQENAELINAIVSENVDLGAANVSNVEDYQTDFVRHQGDKLIACLRDIVNTLDQLHGHVQECE